MAEFPGTLLKLTMALLLSLSFVIPANAVFFAPDQKECLSCLAAMEEIQPANHCCQDEDSGSPETPCQGDDCECPDCPFCHSVAASLHGILFSANSFALSPGHAVFSPNIGLDFEILKVAPPLPPPRVG